MANTKEINPKTGKRLKELIKSQRMTQEQFGEKVGLVSRQISLIVTGKRRLTEDNARRISNLFPPIRYEWLMGWDDYRTANDYRIGFKTALDNRLDLLRDDMRKEEVIFSILRFFNMDLKISHDGLEELDCFQRHKEHISYQNIHSLDFDNVLVEHDDSEGFKEYYEFIKSKSQSAEAYILINKLTNEHIYISEAEKNSLFLQVIEYMEFIGYKLYRLFDEKKKED